MWSSIVVKIDKVPSLLSTISMTRDCWGQSMWDAVLISQKPPDPSARLRGLISLLWLWPLIQAMTFLAPQQRSATTRGPRMRGFARRRCRCRSFFRFLHVWWLATMTALSRLSADRGSRLQPT